MIRQGDVIRFRPEWQDEGDEDIRFVAVDDESKGRVTVRALLDLPINPTQIVRVDMVQS